MAVVALNSAQKDALRLNAVFRNSAKWAMLDKARVFVASDGETTPGSVTRIKWAQFRFLGVSFLQDPSRFDNDAFYTAFAEYVTDTFDNVANNLNDPNVVAGLLSGARYDAISDQMYLNRALGVDF